MRNSIHLGLAAALVVFAGCSDETAVTEPDVDAIVFDAPLDLSEPPSGGTCPDVYWETTEELDDGVMLTWRSAFGGFSYGVTDAYAVQVEWTLTGATLLSASFVERAKGNNTWTPKSKRDPVSGSFTAGTPNGSSLPLTVNMSAMHRGDEDLDGDGVPDWRGLIGNGHFWLVLQLDGFQKAIKLGVNVHLEDPDDLFDHRCPTG
jgi:hypothetical protein